MATAFDRACMLLAFLVAVLSTVASASACQNPLIFIDIHDRQVTGHANLSQYGLWIGMGTPSQNDSLWPAITQNETIFAATDFCGPSSSRTCAQNSRGFISTNVSDSWHDDNSNRTADQIAVFAGASYRTGRDTLIIRTQPTDPGPPLDMTLEHFPMMLLSNYSSPANPICGPAGVFGLGPSSKALTHMIDENLITSRSYGLYMGPKLQNAGHLQRGSLVLGGYDAGRFRYPLVEYPQSPASVSVENAYSPFKVNITQVSLLLDSGRSMIPLSNNSFDAFISTSQKAIRFPRDVTSQLARILGVDAVPNGDDTLRVRQPFDGALSITLDGQLTLTFNSSWLVDDAGNTPISAEPLNNGGPLNSTEPASDEGSFSAILGAAFLTQAYMFVNHDAKPPSFSLAQALPDIQEVVPQPFCPGVVPVPISQPANSSKGRLSRKVLIGAVIGSVVGMIILPIFIWAYLTKRLPGQRKKMDYPPHDLLRGDNLLQSEKCDGAVHCSNRHLDAIDEEDAVQSNYVYSVCPERSQSQRPSVMTFTTQSLIGKRRRSTTTSNSRKNSFRVRASESIDGRFNYEFYSAPLTEYAEVTSARALRASVPVSSYSRLYQDHYDEREQSPPRYEFTNSIDTTPKETVSSDFDKSLPTTPATSSRQSMCSTSGSLVFFSLEQPPPVPDIHSASAKQTPLSRAPSVLLPSPDITVPIPIHPNLSRAAFLRSSYHPSTFSVPSLRSVASLPSISPPEYSSPTTPTSVSTWYWPTWRSRSQSASRPKSSLTMTSQSSGTATSREDISKPLAAVATVAKLRRLPSAQSRTSSGLRDIVIHKAKELRSKNRRRARERTTGRDLVSDQEEVETMDLVAEARGPAWETHDISKISSGLNDANPRNADETLTGHLSSHWRNPAHGTGLLAVPLESARWSSTELEQALAGICADLDFGSDSHASDSSKPTVSAEASFFPNLASSPVSSADSRISASAYASVYGRMPTPMLTTGSAMPIKLSPGAPPIPTLPTDKRTA